MFKKLVRVVIYSKSAFRCLYDPTMQSYANKIKFARKYAKKSRKRIGDVEKVACEAEKLVFPDSEMDVRFASIKGNRGCKVRIKVLKNGGKGGLSVDRGRNDTE